MSPDFTPPHADLTFMAPLSEERASRLVSFLVDGQVSTGFAPLAVHEPSLDEWDVFEPGYAAEWLVS